MRGVPAGQDVLMKSTELIYKELKMTIQRRDIKFALRIGKEGREEEKPVRVVFNDEKTKN